MQLQTLGSLCTLASLLASLLEAVEKWKRKKWSKGLPQLQPAFAVALAGLQPWQTFSKLKCYYKQPLNVQLALLASIFLSIADLNLGL